MKRNFLIIILLLSSTLFSEDKIDLLSGTLNQLYEWTWEDDIDIDVLVDNCANILVDILENDPLDIDENMDSLKITKSTNGDLSIYTFSYYTGGTRGDAYNSVVQWPKIDGSFRAYFLGEVNIYEIHKLPLDTNSELYLIIGSEKSSSISIYSYAFALYNVGGELKMDYPLFFNKTSKLGLMEYLDEEDFSSLEFNPETQEIIVDCIYGNDELFTIYNNNYTVLNMRNQSEMVFQFNGEYFQ